MFSRKLIRLFAIGFISSILILTNSLFAQTEDWKKETSKDGKIEIEYHISDRLDKDGEEVQLIEYVATTITDLNLEQCVKTMRNVASHKQFMGNTEESIELETISENEWLAYYFFEPPWPMPDNDCVMKVSLEELEDERSIVFKGVSEPKHIAMKDVKRLEHYEYEYSFTEKATNEIEFSIAVRLTPVSSAPNWMMKSWFPKGPTEFMEKFITLASTK